MHSVIILGLHHDRPTSFELLVKVRSKVVDEKSDNSEEEKGEHNTNDHNL